MISLGYDQQFLAGGLSYALQQASWPGLLVIVVLLFVSSLSWAVMVTKYRGVIRATRASREFLQTWRTESALAMFTRGQRFEESPHYRIYHEGCVALTRELVGDVPVDAGLTERLEHAPKLEAAQLETVQLMVQKSLGEASLQLEAQTALLASAVSGGPFLGLLGTVWGVMDTFSAIAESTSAASVKDMAPGVAAALVTTVVGLLVAIPAMFGHNFLVSKVRAMVLGLENFSVELVATWQRDWLDHGGRRPGSVRPSVIAAMARQPQPDKEARLREMLPLHEVNVEGDPADKRQLPVDPESGLSED